MATSDKEHAENVRRAAKEFAAALNEAAKAGLLMTITASPRGLETFANGDRKDFAWEVNVTIWRTGHV